MPSPQRSQSNLPTIGCGPSASARSYSLTSARAAFSSRYKVATRGSVLATDEAGAGVPGRDAPVRTDALSRLWPRGRPPLASELPQLPPSCSANFPRLLTRFQLVQHRPPHLFLLGRQTPAAARAKQLAKRITNRRACGRDVRAWLGDRPFRHSGLEEKRRSRRRCERQPQASRRSATRSR